MRFVPRPSKWKYYVMLAVIHTIGRMPLRWRYVVARFTADRIYDHRGAIWRNVRNNVRHVLGPEATEEAIERVSRQCARNTGRYYADVVGMHRMDLGKFYEHELVLEGLEHVRAAQAAGHGVVLASAHYANPEFAVQGLAAAGITVFALVEPLEPPELGRLMRGLRTKHGHRYEPVSFGAIKNALAWLRGGGVVCILIDRDIQKRGIEVDFCGYPARFPTGAADLALRTKAALIPGWVRRERGYKVRATIMPPLAVVDTGNREADIRINTENLLRSFEAHLKQDPGQWSVLDPIWRDELPAREAALPRESAAS